MEYQDFIKTLNVEKMAKEICFSNNKIKEVSLEAIIEYIAYTNTKLFIEILREYDKWKSENK